MEVGYRLCVLMIDFSSEKIGGSIFGDKIRMEKLFVDECVFIWLFVLGNELGGVVCGICEIILLCEVVGYDFLIIEIVGVG